jgi:hypothetical protein
MKYLKQYDREISQTEFEEVMGKIPLIEPEIPVEAYPEAVEMTPRDSITSCIIYLDQKPPEWLLVGRRWPDGVDTHGDWKYEPVMAWDGEKYTQEWRYFMPVEITGGWYNPGAGEIGPFTFWLAAKPGHTIGSVKVAGIGWKENHQHTNIYFTLGEPPDPPDPEPPDPEPPDPGPPDPDPPCCCDCTCEKMKGEIALAREHIEQADAHLAEADRLADSCACICCDV